MRLIDADAMVADLLTVDPQYETMIDWTVGVTMAQPTVDAVPVRHGKWIHEVRYTIDSLHSYQQYRCSECDMAYITNTKYCPNCGARMVEDE